MPGKGAITLLNGLGVIAHLIATLCMNGDAADLPSAPEGITSEEAIFCCGNEMAAELEVRMNAAVGRKKSLRLKPRVET